MRACQARPELVPYRVGPLELVLPLQLSHACRHKLLVLKVDLENVCNVSQARTCVRGRGPLRACCFSSTHCRFICSSAPLVSRRSCSAAAVLHKSVAWLASGTEVVGAPRSLLSVLSRHRLLQPAAGIVGRAACACLRVELCGQVLLLALRRRQLALREEEMRSNAHGDNVTAQPPRHRTATRASSSALRRISSCARRPPAAASFSCGAQKRCFGAHACGYACLIRLRLQLANRLLRCTQLVLWPRLTEVRGGAHGACLNERQLGGALLVLPPVRLLRGGAGAHGQRDADPPRRAPRRALTRTSSAARTSRSASSCCLS